MYRGESRVSHAKVQNSKAIDVAPVNIAWICIYAHPHGCTKQHNGRTPTRKDDDGGTASHNMSSHYSGGVELQRPRVRLIGAFGGGCAWLWMLLVHEVGTRLISIMALFCSRVRSVKWIGPVWRDQATLKPLYAQPTRDRPLFTFRISTMKTCACVYMRLQEMFFRLCVFFFVVYAHDTAARGTRLIVCSFNLSEIITSRLVCWTHFFLSPSVVIYEGHCRFYDLRSRFCK